MQMPDWLRTPATSEVSHVTSHALRGKHDELFVDKTLRHVLSFIEDSMFNETVSAKDGLLQKIEPRLKIITLLLFIFVLSLQKSMGGIAIFLFPVVLLVLASQIPLRSFLKKLLPAATITACVSVPVILNLVVGGDPLFVLSRLERPMNIGPIVVPGEIAITEQGLKSALTLLLRVLVSVSFVFLMIMTTRPNTFMKSVSSLIPGPLNSVVSISYRYIFLLVRKTEQFIIGLKSRQLSAVKTAGGQRWAASRIGLLFSISMELSDDLAMAMESRGYRGDKFEIQNSTFKIKTGDMFWLVFTVLFCGAMVWKSLT
jgi:cobalt/nickel transport system permease protein